MAEEDVIKSDEETEESEEEKEESVEEDKTSEEEEDSEKNEGGDKSKNRKSSIAQKKYWRGKAKTEGKKRADLEAELEKLKGMVKKPTDEQEAKAQEYIRSQAREVFKELELEKRKAETKESEEFDSAVQEIIDDNPDISQDELLDAIEEYEVSPKVALRILQKQGASKETKKPKMPSSKRPPSDKKASPPDDKEKSMFDIVREETDRASSST